MFQKFHGCFFSRFIRKYFNVYVRVDEIFFFLSLHIRRSIALRSGHLNIFWARNYYPGRRWTMLLVFMMPWIMCKVGQLKKGIQIIFYVYLDTLGQFFKNKTKTRIRLVLLRSSINSFIRSSKIFFFCFFFLAWKYILQFYGAQKSVDRYKCLGWQILRLLKNMKRSA